MNYELVKVRDWPLWPWKKRFILLRDKFPFMTLLFYDFLLSFSRNISENWYLFIILECISWTQLPGGRHKMFRYRHNSIASIVVFFIYLFFSGKLKKIWKAKNEDQILSLPYFLRFYDTLFQLSLIRLFLKRLDYSSVKLWDCFYNANEGFIKNSKKFYFYFFFLLPCTSLAVWNTPFDLCRQQILCCFFFSIQNIIYKLW